MKNTKINRIKLNLTLQNTLRSYPLTRLTDDTSPRNISFRRSPNPELAQLYSLVSKLPSNTVDPWKKSSLKCNLVYVKVPKCASSTLAGLTRQFAAHYEGKFNYLGIREHVNKKEIFENTDHCHVISNHYPLPGKLPQVITPELKKDTFLFTFLRNPRDRMISQMYHFGFSRKKKKFKEYLGRKYIEENFKTDYVLRWVGSMHEICNSRTMLHRYLGKRALCFEKIFDTYDFIGVVERFDESLVVMKMLFDLSFKDILYVSSAKQTGFDGSGVKIEKTKTSAKFNEYYETKMSSYMLYLDELFHQLADFKLSNTISGLGQSKFEKELFIFLNLKKTAAAVCKGKVFSPYDDQGNFQPQSVEDCYWNDNGCGIICLEEFTASKIFQSIIKF
eukprot:snap_masked-scaffold_22-processed-gene-1.7-mRNA-1 protein AED:1.00 eAED:1.00 QI:0/0/0/0/1/1/2/0/389